MVAGDFSFVKDGGSTGIDNRKGEQDGMWEVLSDISTVQSVDTFTSAPSYVEQVSKPADPIPKQWAVAAVVL
jgi:hypothetical protein